MASLAAIADNGYVSLGFSVLYIAGVLYVVFNLGRMYARVEDRWEEWRRARRGPQPKLPPIEQLAFDVRRIGRRLAMVPAGTAVARVNGIILAYDGALADAATSLGIDHTITELPLGEGRDMERFLLESKLEDAGLVIRPSHP